MIVQMRPEQLAHLLVVKRKPFAEGVTGSCKVSSFTDEKHLNAKIVVLVGGPIKAVLVNLRNRRV